jgi:hypothetical protein
MGKLVLHECSISASVPFDPDFVKSGRNLIRIAILAASVIRIALRLFGDRGNRNCNQIMIELPQCRSIDPE